MDAFSKVIKIKYKVDTSNESLKESKLLHLVSIKNLKHLNWKPIGFEKLFLEQPLGTIKSKKISLMN